MLAALAVAGLIAWQRLGNPIEEIFGKPATAVGQALYPNLTASEVKHIEVKVDQVEAAFSLSENGWMASKPWQDRMDPRAAWAIVEFTRGMRVEDHAKVDETDPAETGLKGGSVHIKLLDSDRQILATYRIGRRSPWMAAMKPDEPPVPTVFVQAREHLRKDHIYTCTGDITSWFGDGLKHLRDHRPFYFNPLALKSIQIISAEGELTLSRESVESPWRIAKPLALKTDPAAVKTLIEGLYELQAAKVADRDSITLLNEDAVRASTSIALTSFGDEKAQVLEIMAAKSAEINERVATLNQRPDAVFEFPSDNRNGEVAIADLPLSVNALRDRSLTQLQVASLREITIKPAVSAPIRITRQARGPWMTIVNGVTSEANEERLFSLLKAVTEVQASDFISDAATDFSPWGIDRPILTLSFRGESDQTLTLLFGMDENGRVFINRQGTATVMEVEPNILEQISTQAYEWQHARLWSISRASLQAIERKMEGESAIFLKYNDRHESWQVEQDGKDITGNFNAMRANFMLGELEGLKVWRWLPANDEAASRALLDPSATFTVLEQTTNDMGDFTGFSKRTLRLAPNQPSQPRFYYGYSESSRQYFLLDKESYSKLTIDLLEKF